MLSFKGTHVNYTRIVILNYARIVATEKSSLITRYFFLKTRIMLLYIFLLISLLIRCIVFIWGDFYTFFLFIHIIVVQTKPLMYVQNQLLDARCIWISGSRTSIKQSCYDYKQAAAALSIILEYFYIVAIEVIVAQMKLGNYVWILIKTVLLLLSSIREM